MAKRKTPWNDDDFVYFELQTPEFEVFEFQSSGGLYKVAKFEPGIYRLLIDSIREPTDQECKKKPSQLFSVDMCQMFVVDKSRVAAFREALDPEKGAWPNYSYFEQLRRTVGVDFGFYVVNIDGGYILDLSALELAPSGKKSGVKKKTAITAKHYLKVARQMRTFICEKCMAEELMEPPKGDADELAELAKKKGWILVPPPAKRKSWFFQEFQVVGPKCAAKH